MRLGDKQTQMTRKRDGFLTIRYTHRSTRLLNMQENVTAMTEENTRLSRSIEADRMVVSDLRRTNDDMKSR